MNEQRGHKQEWNRHRKRGGMVGRAQCRSRALCRAGGCIALVAAFTVIGSSALAAENVVYGGVGGLQPDIMWLGTFSVGPSGITPPDGAPSVSENNVSVNYTPDGTNDITGNVYGAFRLDATAVYDNRLTLTSGTVAHHLFGGYSRFGAASDNDVALNGGAVAEHVFGGWSSSAAAFGNGVALTGAAIGHSIYGGYSGTGAVNLNQVVVNSGMVGDYIYGGRSENLTAAQNAVTLYGGTVGLGVYGGSGGSGASNNTLTMTAGTVGFFVIGGFSDGGDATGNTVSINGGAVGSEVSGGSSAVGNTSGNTVVIGGGTVGEAVYGGWSSDGDANNNRAILSSGSVGWGLHGGYGQSGSASGNTVEVIGGTVGLDVVGGLATAGDAIQNEVTISGGLADRHVFGGWSNLGNATGNTVTISGGAVSESVYGGYVFNGGGNATGNTVNLAGNPIFGLTTRIMGGGTLTGTGDLWTGNTLQVSTSNITVAEVNNFQNYSFYLPATLNNGGTVLEITGATPTNLNNTTVTVTGIEDGSPLVTGNKVTLIDSTANSPANNNTIQEVRKGAVRIYDVKIYDQANALYAELVSDRGIPIEPGTPTPFRLDPQAKSLSEGRLAGLAAANLGNDLMQERGLGALLAATQQTAGFSAFGAMEGLDERIDTGSHIDLTGFSMVAGVGRGIEVGTSRLTLGAFFETGVGNYDAYNSFATGSVEADGDSNYYGGGLGGRYDIACGAYAVATFRIGHSTTDYESGDITYQGQHAGFETSATYYGGQAGIGYLWRPASDKVLDLYSKWLWTHLGSDEVSVLGDPVQFKSADSHRWRTGGRFEAKMRERFSPYAGLAYEYEFDGDSEATAYGLNIDTPSLKGGTGIGEAGVRVDNLFNAGQLSLDLGVQGYVGQREGIGATGSLKWVF